MSNILRTKCVIVGNSTVGKTALAKVFLSDGREFPKNYNMVRLICTCINGCASVCMKKESQYIAAHAASQIISHLTKNLKRR
jgi:GTPase SAR1 family protein